MNGEQIRKELNYANTDFDSLRQEIEDLIPLLTPRWTNVESADVGMALVNVFCGIGDMLGYYFNEQAKETYLPTLRLRESLINVTKLIGYDLNRPTAPRTTLDVVFTQPLVTEAVIRRYDEFLTQDGGTSAVATEDVALLPGISRASVPVLQGKPKVEYFTATGGPLQRYVMTSQNVGADLIEVVSGEKVYAELTRDIYLTDPDRMFVRIETDAFNNSTLVFSDKLARELPVADETIMIRFVETQVKRLIPHMVTKTSGNLLAESHKVEQPTGFRGGADAISTEDAKAQAPQELKTLWRAVVPDDYKALLTGYRGCRKVRIFDNNNDPTLSVHRVQAYIVTEDSQPMTEPFKEELEAFMNRVKMVTTKVSIHDAQYVPVAVTAKLYVYAGYQEELVVSRVTEAIKDFFALKNQDFGAQIHDSALIAAIHRVDGLSHIELVDWEDVLLAPRQFAVYDEATLFVEGVV